MKIHSRLADIMNKILSKVELASDVKKFIVEVPDIAKKIRAGQFIVLRFREEGERIPLSVADYDSDAGTITLVFKEIGRTTIELGRLNEGDEILDLIGPLGTPSHVEKYGHVVAVGGGIGTAPCIPYIRALKEAGNKITTIIGAQSESQLILTEEAEKYSDKVIITTDDGSAGQKGLVTQALQEIIDSDEKPDLVFAAGPGIMMKFVAKTTEPYKIKTFVSLNSIMVDGTGMCGACRCSIGDDTKFACVDGPDFDGHQVDFDLLMTRQRQYCKEEEQAMNRLKELDEQEGR
jgi:ferredoxin--NADP+ reductase